MIEVLTVAQMTEADRRTIAGGTPGRILMDRAGLAVADAVARRLPLGAAILVACGPGNNGGDGFVAARILAERGFKVRVVLLGSREALDGDAAAAARWRGPVEAPGEGDVAGAAAIVDALFGAGLSRPVDGEARALIERIDAAGVPAIAVDLPSGIDGDTGAVLGIAVRAVETVTFCRRKPGHLLMPGRLHAGAVRVADIGIDAETVSALYPNAFLNVPALWSAALAVPTLADHKYTRGHAVAMAGPRGRTGAARLAARAALRAGAGLVTIACPPDARDEVAFQSMAVMSREVADGPALAAFLADPRFRALCIGPGLGEDARAGGFIEAALAADVGLVLDADAVTAFAGRPAALAEGLAARPDRPAVLTPHDGEFAQLFRNGSEIIEIPSKLERARKAAARLGVVMVLKGADTVVASPDGRAAIAGNAPPWLATAGSGDVLAGLATGLLAQRMPAFEAACAAVWLHGEAGRAAGPGLIAEDLPEALPAILKALYADLDIDLATGLRR